jgi:DNA-binding NarL/FixJ family response regulator
MRRAATTIILADDHQVVRQGLRALLEQEPDFAVVAEAADGLQAAELVERLKPNALVLDLLLPGLSGLDVALRVAKRSPQTRIVVLSMHATEAHVTAALRHGASAYVTKDASASELVRAIREACAGRRYLSAPFSSVAIEAYLRQEAGGSGDPYQSLTTREREVLHLAAEGRSSAEIALRLNISPRTVETHRANALHKLGLKGQTDVVLYAIEHGLLAPARVGPLRRGEGGAAPSER